MPAAPVADQTVMKAVIVAMDGDQVMAGNERARIRE